MDVQMPEMDGFEATAAIRAREQERGAHVPIVAMTAHAMKGDRERCIEAGMDGYVAKPLQPQELFDAIESVTRDQRPATNEQRPTTDGELEPAVAEARASAIDEAALLHRVGGDRELLRELVALFLESYPRQLTELREAATRGDGAAVERGAHAMKGSVGNFSAQAAFQLALRLEEMGRSGDLTGAAALVGNLEEELERLRSALAVLGREA
jgi:two-component system, sensor histidine kinase and response regulator